MRQTVSASQSSKSYSCSCQAWFGSQFIGMAGTLSMFNNRKGQSTIMPRTRTYMMRHTGACCARVGICSVESPQASGGSVLIPNTLPRAHSQLPFFFLTPFIMSGVRPASVSTRVGECACVCFCYNGQIARRIALAAQDLQNIIRRSTDRCRSTHNKDPKDTAKHKQTHRALSLIHI